MITTINIKAKLREVFQVGNGPKKILILGSCRTVAYVNYLNRYNQSHGEPFTIYVIEPNNYHWNEQEQEVNLEEELTKCETNERILSIIRSTDIFIHEFYQNFGMFNTEQGPKNIYSFGMAPKMDILIPNLHDRFVLENDYVACGMTAPSDYVQRGEQAISEFCDVCRKSSFPEFADVFRDTWRRVRYCWRPNHVSAAFTLYIFKLMNDKFLHLDLDEAFWNGAGQEDLFKEPHTQVTENDRKAYGITW